MADRASTSMPARVARMTVGLAPRRNDLWPLETSLGAVVFYYLRPPLCLRSEARTTPAHSDLLRTACAPTFTHSNGFCVIWVCISSSSSLFGGPGHPLKPWPPLATILPFRFCFRVLSFQQSHTISLLRFTDDPHTETPEFRRAWFRKLKQNFRTNRKNN
jgi:hypothetical protein